MKKSFQSLILKPLINLIIKRHLRTNLIQKSVSNLLQLRKRRMLSKRMLNEERRMKAKMKTKMKVRAMNLSWMTKAKKSRNLQEGKKLQHQRNLKMIVSLQINQRVQLIKNLR